MFRGLLACTYLEQEGWLEEARFDSNAGAKLI